MNEPNPFEQSFGTDTSAFEYIQNHKLGSDTSSYKSNVETVCSIDSNSSSNYSIGIKKKQRKRAPKKFKSEEERREFLERNRLAALKCRQRKKQWLSNLQERIEFLTRDNEQLELETNELRQEIINLKQLLLTHKDCPQYKQHPISY
ncbi:hypothetical protein G6F57_008468 [Rhizopus arrhizus]|uniref:BZIP domain-containing protein n=1 Tax=Rhizopus oryzae TaxID=64495 RepID=A0A9P6X6J9_RHIOR|nr:hypothetical protein G6F23_012483 [Rhizopus arrhizus]KAG1391829.1 hypothetical protein G6F58_012632 [Rhizopus delemar]KAG0776599.1 hypothetical protein G6F21_013601 [Rhizopus arrhizus]KAG0810588.1 hypothetical protein G6F20_007840 [Rhizopus arrhizus]KAG0817238.1 hypothetical protein G6F18_012936 [Rhizopus arrhizus]